MYSDIIKLGNILRKLGFKKESEYVIKLSTPIDDIYYHPADVRHNVPQDKPLPIPPEINQDDLDIYHHEDAYRDLFLNVKEMIDIFVVPDQLRLRGSNILSVESYDINLKDFYDSAAFSNRIISNIGGALERENESYIYRKELKGQHKYDIDKYNQRIVKIEDYIKNHIKDDNSLLKKVLTDIFKRFSQNKINVIVGLLDNSNDRRELLSVTPFWLAHDLYHNFKDGNDSMKDFDSTSFQIIHGDSVDKVLLENIKQVADKYTPGVGSNDLHGTLFAILVTGVGADELKEILPPNDYNTMQRSAVISMKGLLGNIIFL
jgi:hypothetical protein